MLRDSSLVPLSHQHQHGLALTVLIARGLSGDPPPEKAAELALMVASMAKAELLGHFQVEEQVLFPAIRSRLESGDIVDDLIAEHRQMEGSIERIASASGRERVRLLTEFGELLSRHIRVEERQLFEEIQTKLDAGELKRLGGEIGATVQRICPVTSQLPWEKRETSGSKKDPLPEQGAAGSP